MPFDMKKYKAPAEHHDVASVALDAALALQAVSSALKKLAANQQLDLQEELAEMESARSILWETFVDLTGYTPK